MADLIKAVGEAMKEREAAEFLGLSESTLRKARMQTYRPGRLPPPPYIRLGRSIQYRRSALIDYLAAHTVNHSDSRSDQSNRVRAGSRLK